MRTSPSTADIMYYDEDINEAHALAQLHATPTPTHSTHHPVHSLPRPSSGVRRFVRCHVWYVMQLASLLSVSFVCAVQETISLGANFSRRREKRVSMLMRSSPRHPARRSTTHSRSSTSPNCCHGSPRSIAGRESTEGTGCPTSSPRLR